MGTSEQWLQILALVKALFKAITAGIDLAESVEKYTHDPETIREAERVSRTNSTYSSAEVEAILARLKGCEARFIEQGGGADRNRCVCSVLRETKKGNGGMLPYIDDWENIYTTLNCGRFER